MTSKLNIEHLLNALENEDNASVIKLNYNKIASDKNNIIQQLHLQKEQLKTIIKQLKMYRLIDNIDELRYGNYIRWISLKSNSIIKLTNGGLICHIKQINENIHLICKNNFGQLFQLNMSENIIFQKLNQQEQVILSALKHLES